MNVSSRTQFPASMEARSDVTAPRHRLPTQLGHLLLGPAGEGPSWLALGAGVSVTTSSFLSLRQRLLAKRGDPAANTLGGVLPEAQPNGAPRACQRLRVVVAIAE